MKKNCRMFYKMETTKKFICSFVVTVRLSAATNECNAPLIYSVFDCATVSTMDANNEVGIHQWGRKFNFGRTRYNFA